MVFNINAITAGAEVLLMIVQRKCRQVIMGEQVIRLQFNVCVTSYKPK